MGFSGIGFVILEFKIGRFSFDWKDASFIFCLQVLSSHTVIRKHAQQISLKTDIGRYSKFYYFVYCNMVASQRRKNHEINSLTCIFSIQKCVRSVERLRQKKYLINKIIIPIIITYVSKLHIYNISTFRPK